MDISFRLDPETIIGTDTISMAGTVCGRYGERIMIAADHALDSQSVRRLKDILEDSRLEVIVFDGIHEDSGADMAENIVELCRAAHCTTVIGFGGPKTQTIARLTAIMAPLRISVYEMLDGRNFRNKFLPFIAIPTAGIDAFLFTNYFPVIDPRDRLVKSVISPDKLCAAVIIDSSLSAALSGESAALFIFDGFCTAIEAYCSTKANFLSDALLERALHFYAKLLKTGSSGIDSNTAAQAGFLASLGTSLSSPGIGAVLALAINARFPAEKQRYSTALLPLIVERLAGVRPEKMARAASFLGNTGGYATVAEAANSAVSGIRRSMEALNVRPELKDLNISLDRVIAAAEAARKLEFAANSPWTVSEEEVFKLLKQIL
jgi:alcohol dehydrogenase